MDKTIIKYEKQNNLIFQKAESLEISNADEMKEAVEVLSQINQGLDQIKEEKGKVLDPINAAAKAERARWKPLEEVFTGAVTRIRGLMSTYQTAEVERKKEEEAKIAARVKKGRGNLKAETAIAKMGEIDEVEEKVETESGGVSFREKKVLEIYSEQDIPKKYWIIDEDAVFTDLKKGIQVKGAKIKLEQIPVNKR